MQPITESQKAKIKTGISKKGQSPADLLTKPITRRCYFVQCGAFKIHHGKDKNVLPPQNRRTKTEAKTAQGTLAAIQRTRL